MEINKNQCTHMLHCVWGPALHSPVAPIATDILSSNAGERDPRPNAKCENCHTTESKFLILFVKTMICIHSWSLLWSCIFTGASTCFHLYISSQMGIAKSNHIRDIPWMFLEFKHPTLNTNNQYLTWKISLVGWDFSKPSEHSKTHSIS